MKLKSPSILNRSNFKKLLSDNQITVLKGNDEIIRSKDIYYPFRQNSNFLYLTGVNIPKCITLITNKLSLLFIPEVNKKMFIWNAPYKTKNEIKNIYKFNYVYYKKDFDEIFKKLSKEKQICLTSKEFINDLRKLNQNLIFKNKEFENILANLRSVKNNIELQLMQNASSITSLAFIKTIESIKAGLYEYQIQSIFEKELHYNKISQTAFPSIIASGKNSSILHYTLNSKKLKSGELCLIDAGGEFEGYAADITRTIPVSGKFSNKQKEIYEIVLKAQNECIKYIKPEIKLIDIQNLCIDIIVDGLINIGILKNLKENIIKNKTYLLFFPHGVSHLLGLDTHDVSPLSAKKIKDTSLRNNVVLKKGMVLTIEPGIYFNPHILSDKKIQTKHKNNVNWDKVSKYMNFGGIRIEDNVFINNNSCINLTKVPKNIEEIENLFNKED